MKKKQTLFMRVLAFLLVTAMTFISAIPTTSVEVSAASKAVKSVSVKVGSKSYKKKTYSLAKGKTCTLKVGVSPSSAKKSITYSSSKKSVATVSKSGKVTAKKTGTAKITITVKGKNGKKTKTWVKIKVTNPKISKSSATITKGSTLDLTVSGTTSSPTWSTSNKSVATIKKISARKYRVTGVKAGTATIKAKVNGKTLSCKVTVKNSSSSSTTATSTTATSTTATTAAPSTGSSSGGSSDSGSGSSSGSGSGSGSTTTETPSTDTGSGSGSGSSSDSGSDSSSGTVSEDGLVLDLVVKDGVATDLVSGDTFSGITVSGDYMYGGTVTLPSSYTQWTYEMIMDYNEDSSSGVISNITFTSNSGKYESCSNVFKLNELSAISNRGSVCIPWVKDSWNTGYTVTIPVQLYAHISTDYEYFPEGDSFWSFSMDSENGTLNSRIDGATTTSTMATYANDDGDTEYVDKKFPSSFKLTGAHAVKEIRFYSKAISEEEQEEHYNNADIEVPTSGINQIIDGLTDLGSSLFFSRTTGEDPVAQESETEAGTYTVSDGDEREVSYTISDYEQPDNEIDNSEYESVHITNEPETLTVGKQYPLTAYPYPFSITGSDDGTSDEFDIEWESSDTSVMTVIDGLLIAKKAGTVQITATLMGTDMTDTVTIKVVEAEEVEDNAWNVPSDYVSKDGYSFSDTDYESTTRAIYAAIDEAAENGYNHIIFPKQNFYAVPVADENGYTERYYIPSNMTIEFPEGSTFYMMDNEYSRGDPTKVEIHYFEFGVPNSDYENTCENSSLIIDKYYGERYNTSYSEDDYLEEMRFVEFGRKAYNCSVEIREANYPTGYFITADGTCSTNKTTGVMNYGDFVSGWINENGELEENENWISTSDFITVPDYGKDGYFLSADGQDSYSGKYWGGCSARQYDILWYDSDYNLIQTDRFQGRGDYYDIPEDAAYCKVSLQQSSLPTPGDGETEDSPWIALHDDGSAKMCELKNTNVYNSATGVFSVVGETDGLWVHHCYTNKDGMKPNDERTGDFENGWTQSRHSVVSNCMLKGYFGNPGSYNTFIHTCYMTNYSGFGGNTEMMRFINNTCYYVEVSEKCQAHIYNNTIYGVGVDRFNTSYGHVYQQNNNSGKWVNAY